ncbi:MAG: M1 family aminopeptidase, partial [Gemmataceae bacterium]
LSEQREGDHRTLRFADTMKMSTYLVAFLVGEWEGGEPTHVGPTPLQVWSVPGKRHLTGFARDIAAFSLRYFEDYYDLPYPADKLDLIAVPDFAAGAMENLGAITFRETALLLDESRATHAEKERVADVVAHENAHMWFGDLVTMRWWNGLWLNEAFATFMEMLAVDAWKPAWQRWATFASSRAAALVIDGLRSSRPIEFPVRAPRDADAMFDVLTYDKGAAVLRMLEQFLSPEVFRAGVRLYLRRHAHDNTDTADLWHALAEAAHLDIPSIMDEWIFQAGYPLVQVRREGSDLVLRQQAFSYLRATEPDSRRLWKIPVRVRVDNPTSTEFHRVLLRNEEARMPLPSGAKAVLVNEGSHGFYRVRYDNSLLDALLDRLPSLDASERFTLVNDLWAGVLAGMIPLTEFLERTRLFHGERDRLVWSALLNSQGLLLRLVDDGDRPALRSRIRALLRGAVADLGWQSRDGEDELRQQLRGDLLRAMGILGDDPAVQREAALVYTGGQAEANVHSAAVAILAHAGDAARYEEFQDRFRQSGTPQEEQRYLLALAGFRPAALVERTLQACRDGTIRNQDAPLVLRTMLQQVHSREATWQFLRHHGED